MSEGGQQVTQAMQPNFVLMKLPGESGVEFVEILPFTPANRNNLMAGLPDAATARNTVRRWSTTSPKRSLSTDPCKSKRALIRTRSFPRQLTLWNQQGSHVRRGALLVIHLDAHCLYAEPIYFAGRRSPMPELRLVVLAVQDRLAYGPTFESAMSAFLVERSRHLAPRRAPRGRRNTHRHPPDRPTAADVNALIRKLPKTSPDYQRLTAEGNSGGGQKLEQLKRALEKLNTRQR